MPTLYVTPEEADDWCNQRGYLEWLELDIDTKNACLINASEWVDRLHHFRGLPEDNTQTCAWPRRDAFRDDGRAILGVPPEVKDAVQILAMNFAEGEQAAEELLGTTSRITSEKAGSIQVQYETLPPRNRSKITRILTPVLAPQMQGQLRRG